MELSFAPPDRAKVFQCSKCPLPTQKLRRCHEDREDFTQADNGSVFPIMITPEGQQYGFCPSKATWDSTVSGIYNSLMICAETGNLWTAGGISEQPSWFVELLSMFILRYNDHKFYSRAQAILGDGKGQKAVGPTRGRK